MKLWFFSGIYQRVSKREINTDKTRQRERISKQHSKRKRKETFGDLQVEKIRKDFKIFMLQGIYSS